MNRTVRLMPRAEDDLKGAYRWAARHAPYTAGRWLMRFEDALGRLGHSAERYGAAPEERRLQTKIRQMLFGRKPNVFRAVFVIDVDVVRVLRIRRASRRLLTRKELGDV